MKNQNVWTIFVVVVKRNREKERRNMIQMDRVLTSFPSNCAQLTILQKQINECPDIVSPSLILIQQTLQASISQTASFF